MITPKDLLHFYKSNITADLMNTEDTNETDDTLIQTLIDDSYNELEVLKDSVPSKTLDLYAKVLSLVAFLDRLGIDKSAFIGLNDRADLIRKMIFENMTNTETNMTKKTKISIVRNDDNTIITDDFIDRFGS